MTLHELCQLCGDKDHLKAMLSCPGTTPGTACTAWCLCLTGVLLLSGIVFGIVNDDTKKVRMNPPPTDVVEPGDDLLIIRPTSYRTSSYLAAPQMKDVDAGGAPLQLSACDTTAANSPPLPPLVSPKADSTYSISSIAEPLASLKQFQIRLEHSSLGNTVSSAASILMSFKRADTWQCLRATCRKQRLLVEELQLSGACWTSWET